MPETEFGEVAVRLKDFDGLHPLVQKLNGRLSREVNPKGKPLFEVHSWEKLSPFYNIARMIDVMTFFMNSISAHRVSIWPAATIALVALW
mgnify:CR=1 FL=1